MDIGLHDFGRIGAFWRSSMLLFGVDERAFYSFDNVIKLWIVWNSLCLYSAILVEKAFDHVGFVFFEVVGVKSGWSNSMVSLYACHDICEDSFEFPLRFD